MQSVPQAASTTRELPHVAHAQSQAAPQRSAAGNKPIRAHPHSMDPESPISDSSASPPSPPSLLSPPDSQSASHTSNTLASNTNSSTSNTAGITTQANSHARIAPRNMPVNSSSANANGKRPLNTISNGQERDEDAERALRPGNLAGNTRPTVKEHPASGYKWERLEDEPGYAWLNKKAVDEGNRAAEGLVHVDFMIKGRYGDPIELAEKEAAIIASTKGS